MEIFLNKRAMRQVRLSVADAIEDGEIDALREDLVSVFNDDVVDEIERRIDSGDIKSSRYRFEPELSAEQKFLRALEWWRESAFHLTFAVRSPDLLNEMLGNSLDPDTMKVLYRAKKAGIPFFVNHSKDGIGLNPVFFEPHLERSVFP